MQKFCGRRMYMVPNRAILYEPPTTASMAVPMSAKEALPPLPSSFPSSAPPAVRTRSIVSTLATRVEIVLLTALGPNFCRWKS